MIRQLLLVQAVAVTLCRTGLLFDVPFAVYIYNGRALITWVLETGPSREELGAHHIHHLTRVVGGAVLSEHPSLLQKPACRISRAPHLQRDMKG